MLGLLFFIHLGYFVCLVESSPQITSQLSPITKATGSDVKLTCVVQGKEDAKIQWYFVSGRTSIAIGLKLHDGMSADKYYIEEISNSSDITVSTLKVHELTIEDDGLYRCIVRIPRVAYPAWPRESGWVYVKENIQSSTDIALSTLPTKSLQSNIVTHQTNDSMNNGNESMSSESDKLSGENSSSFIFMNYTLSFCTVILTFILTI